MPTVGNTAKPTASQEWFGGGGLVNQMAQTITMPAGGPWLITRLGAWLAGKDAAADVRLCLWDGSNNLIRQGALFSAAGLSFAVGQSINYEQDITPIEVAGGATVQVGFWRDTGDPVQNGRFSSGSHKHKAVGGGPISMASASTDSSGGLGAYVANYESANVPPNAPINLSPTGDVIVHSGTAPTVSGTRSDPDAGDYITGYHIEVWNDALSTKHYDQTFVVGGTPTTFSRQVSLPASHAFYRWRARTKDKGGLWGSWSGYQRFKANTLPATPGAPTVSSSSTLVPDFAGTFSDPGDTLAAVEIEVQRVSDSAQMWMSNQLPESPGPGWDRAYGGTALAWGTAYRVRYWTHDSHGGSSQAGAWLEWTPIQPLGPNAMTPTGTNPRLASLTPDLTIGHSANFRNDELQVRTEPGGGTLLWDKTWDGSDYAATGSKVRAYAGTALAHGGVYHWRARVELDPSGTISAWSAWYPFRINAAPTAPTGLTPTGGAVLTDTTPELRMTFGDPDTDQGDTPSAVSVEVRNNATEALEWSQTDVAPAPDGASSHVVSPSALTLETTYKWRARFKDVMGLQGAWSAYQVFKVSEPPVVTLVAPTEASVTDDSTPELDWSYSSPGGKAQYSHRVRVFDRGVTGLEDFFEALLALAPVAYWRRLPSSGTTVEDVSGNGHDGTNNSATNAEGLLENDPDPAFGFAAGQTITTPLVPSTDLPDDFTVTAWLKPTGGAGTRRFFIGPSTNPRFYFEISDANVWRFGVGNHLWATGVAPVLGTSYFIVVVGTRATGKLELFVNGVTAGSNTLAFGSPATTARSISDVQGWIGTIDEPAIFNRALTPAEIAELYDARLISGAIVEVYDSGHVVSPATAHTLPHGVLEDDHDYRWSIAARDTDLLETELP